MQTLSFSLTHVCSESTNCMQSKKVIVLIQQYCRTICISFRTLIATLFNLTRIKIISYIIVIIIVTEDGKLPIRYAVIQTYITCIIYILNNTTEI